MRSQPNRAKITPELVQTIAPAEKIFDINDTEVKGFMLRVRPNGDKSYFLRYRNASGANRTYKIASTIEYTPRKARDEAIKLLGSIKDGNDPQEKKRDKRQQAVADKSSPTLREFLDEQYKDYVITHHRTGDKNYKHILACAGDLLDKKLKAISVQDVDAWKSARLKGGAKKSTVDRDVGGIRAAFRKAVEWQLIPDTPFANVKAFNEDNKRIRYLSDAEESQLRAALDDRETKMRKERDSGKRLNHPYVTIIRTSKNSYSVEVPYTKEQEAQMEELFERGAEQRRKFIEQSLAKEYDEQRKQRIMGMTKDQLRHRLLESVSISRSMFNDYLDKSCYRLNADSERNVINAFDHLNKCLIEAKLINEYLGFENVHPLIR